MENNILTEMGYVHNPEGENGLTECYVKHTDKHTDIITENTDNPGYYDRVVMTKTGEVVSEETTQLTL